MKKYQWLFFGLFFVFISLSQISVVRAAPLTGANSDVGIFWFVFGGPIDDTTDANDSDSAGDVSWPAGNQDSKASYIGHLTTKFNKVVVDVSNPTTDVGQNLNMQYWNGSAWSLLSLTAQTHPFDTVGVNSFSFTAPADWATNSVGGTAGYYIRTSMGFGNTENERGFVNAQISQVSVSTVVPAGITVEESGGGTSVTEGGANDTYTLVLDSEPSANVSITITADAQTTLSTTSIIFTPSNWDVPKTITVTATDDDIVEGAHNSTLTHIVTSTDDGYNNFDLNDITVSITDDDAAGITLTQSDGSTAVTEGAATDSYTVVLDSEPIAPVTITLSGGAQLSLSSTTLIFPTSSWNVAQTVTVTGIDDSSVEQTHTGVITHTVTSDDSDYDAFDIDDMSVTVTDNDSAASGGGGTPVSILLPPTPQISLPAGKDPPQTVGLTSNQPQEIKFNNEIHTVTRVSFSATEATIILRSTPKTLILKKDQTKNVDIDEDGVSDIQIVYLGLKNLVPQFVFTDLHEVKVFSLNNNEERTMNQEVTVQFNILNATEFALSNSMDFGKSVFRPFVTSTSWTLSSGEEEKTVYVRLRLKNGGIYDVKDTIVFGTGPVKSEPTCSVTVGKAYKSLESNAVYYITWPYDASGKRGFGPCTKRPFVSAGVFFTYFDSWTSVETIDANILNAIFIDELGFMPRGPKYHIPEGALVKEVSDPRVFLIEKGRRRPIESETIFLGRGYKWASVEDVSSELISQFSLGEVVNTVDVSQPQNSSSFVWGANLQIGSQGEEVEALQIKLQTLGYYTYPEITGYFGGVTRDAVRAFQEKNGIVPLGIVGPKTREVLNRL